MVRILLLSLLAIYLLSDHLVRSADYGVGFDLALDYG
jgi:hypothetical protein